MASPSDRGPASPDEASLDSKRHALADLFGSSDDEASPPPAERLPSPAPAADEADDSDDFDLGTGGPVDSTPRLTRRQLTMSDDDSDGGGDPAPTNPETNDDMADLFGDDASPTGSPLP
ncbi:hypothetical protein H4R35_003760, partial [Dimargaris xerosporica]